MPWRTPVVENNWEYITVLAGGKKIEPFSTIKVRWPNGTIESFKTTRVYRQASVSEQGHLPYIVASEIPGLKLNYHGATIEVRLDKIKCKVWVDNDLTKEVHG